MVRFFKRNGSSVESGTTDEDGSSVPQSSWERLNSSMFVLGALALLVMGLLFWIVCTGPQWVLAGTGSNISISFRLFFSVLALAPMYWLCAGKQFRNNRVFVLTWGAILLQMLFFSTISNMMVGCPSCKELIYMPYLLAPLVVTVLQGSLLGFFVTIATTVLGSFFLLPDDLSVKHGQFILLNMLSGMLTVLVANNLRSRAQVLRAGLFVGILVLGMCCIMSPIEVVDEWDVNTTNVLIQMSSAFGISMMTAVLVGGFLPILEGLFKVITPISWLELGDMNRPLMKRLQMDAPGTFHHSLLVAQLAEAAAEAVGANPVQCRISAYYHDIGKVENPSYFIENIMDGNNPHDTLSPGMSARKIIDHVTHGVELAKSENLPRPLVDVIEQHHGTSLASFFYYKALKQREELLKSGEGEDETATMDDLPEVLEENFRYKGPNPQSREIGIVSLADIVESATRSMGKMTMDEMQARVSDLMRQRVVEGHLDDSGLSLGDLKLIRESFVKTLKSIHHNRITYPAQELPKQGELDLKLNASKTEPGSKEDKHSADDAVVASQDKLLNSVDKA